VVRSAEDICKSQPHNLVYKQIQVIRSNVIIINHENSCLLQNYTSPPLIPCLQPDESSSAKEVTPNF